jgi:hypothetical protein
MGKQTIRTNIGRKKANIRTNLMNKEDTDEVEKEI